MRKIDRHMRLLGEGGSRMVCVGELGSDGRIRPMAKRGYSREFKPHGDSGKRYLLDDIPAGLWADVKAKCKRDGISIRAVILTMLRGWLLSGEKET